MFGASDVKQHGVGEFKKKQYEGSVGIVLNIHAVGMHVRSYTFICLKE